jgi:hypothetical protein
MDFNNLVSGVTLTLPGWALAAAGLGVVLLLILILRPRNDPSGLATLAQLALVAVVGGAAYFGLKQNEDEARFAERKAIEDRATVLLSQMNQPGSVLACLNVSVVPVLDEPCEKMIFAEPQRITSAIAVTADRISLLYDAVNYAAREPGFADRFEPLRKTLEADPYGIVAHVLATEYKCIPESCTRFRIFRESERIKANLTYRKFTDLLARHKESWARSPASEKFGEVSDILTLGIRPENSEALNWGQQDSQTPSSPFTPQATSAEPTTPVATRPNDAAPPANAKQKMAPAKQKQQPAAAPEPQKQQPTAAQQKQQPPSTQARKKGGPPEPVGGLPRVTARGNQNQPAADADDDDDTPAPAPAVAPTPQQNRGPFGIFNR